MKDSVRLGAFGGVLAALALAAVIFERWNPIGPLGFALSFGFADNRQSVLSIIGTPVPMMLSTPYLSILLAGAGMVGRVRATAVDGVPCRKS